MHEGQVDCIYADPPYNTGARDWKYNNNFVDSRDRWRHSKWLGMMERRLRLAKQLLKPDGVLIVTVDENELHHLGMLLERGEHHQRDRHIWLQRGGPDDLGLGQQWVDAVQAPRPGGTTTGSSRRQLGAGQPGLLQVHGAEPALVRW